MKRRLKQIGRVLALSIASVSTLTIVTATPAAADTDIYHWSTLRASVSSGAVNAQLWRDTETTGLFARIGYIDNDAGDYCTYGYMEWRHVNGHSYLDDGTQCSGSSVVQYGVRNQNYYTWVRPCIWIGQYAFSCGEKVAV